MSTTATKTDAEAAIQEPDPTMIPGHPLCNYERYFAACQQVTVFAPTDGQNPHMTSIDMSINGWPCSVVRGQHARIPLPFAEILVSSRRGQIIATP